MKVSAEYYKKNLDLEPHPEGGFYKKVYQSQEKLARAALPERFDGDRYTSTSIYYLLEGHEISHFHRIKSDEIWHFYTGSALTIHMFYESEYKSIELGQNVEIGQAFQICVPAGAWFGAELNDKNSFALVGCTVSPGFDFADFELAQRGALLKTYPEHKELILRLT